MAKKTDRSIEEQIETTAKNELLSIGVHPYAKTEDINQEIKHALEVAPSKNGGAGNNFPDIKVFLTTASQRKIPVMIEVKGTLGDSVISKAIMPTRGKLIKSGVKSNLSTMYIGIPFVSDSGIEDISVDNFMNDKPIYYDLSGRRLLKRVQGIVIKVQGNKSQKLLIK